MPYTPPVSPEVIIIGGGLAGLLLGILCERQGLNYNIFERARTIKPLGAVMGLNANALPIFEQLGLLEELLRVSFPSLGMGIFNEELEQKAFMTLSNYKELTGYNGICFARPELYRLLLSRIPPHRIQFGKRLLSFQEKDDRITACFSDNSSWTGDILVGADGAYSAVRQCLYRQLDDQGLLPKADDQSLNQGYITMVGTTTPMDVEAYPVLKKPCSDISLVIGKNKPYTWSAFTVPNHRFCWSVQIQLSAALMRETHFRNSGWTPESNQEMIADIRDFLTPHGPLGAMIDATPPDLISKVFLEDKLFETWYAGRVVLIGDACHKLLPSAGQGAVNALQDAVYLANCLYDLKDLSVKSVEEAFEDYREQRFSQVKFQFEASRMQAKIMFSQKLFDRMLRKAIFNLPKSILMRDAFKAAAYRPQITFLPRVDSRGSVAPLPQKPSRRYEAEKRQQYIQRASTL